VVDNGSRSVVITGASRGLGLATAAHLYRQGWTVLAAMRAPDTGLKRLAEELGPSIDVRRLIVLPLDLEEPSSIEDAASAVADAVGVPDAIVHNAGVAGAGAVEEMPVDVVERMFTTNLFGAIRLTRELLPLMREAGRGRIVVVSSEAGVRGVAATSAYGASKAALERWAESLAMEIAPFGLGVSVLVTGTFKTDILELTPSWKDDLGPYVPAHTALEAVGDKMRLVARPPARFAPAVERALNETGTFSRRPVGVDATLLFYGSRLLPDRVLAALTTRALRLPRRGRGA
jgi:NAD(P)-dependent dehydrogenase (short-subunit alcohol dehydrogenase family)